MMAGKIKISLIIFILLIVNLSAAAQWKTLYRGDGFSVSFLFYGKADNHNNGVVLKITNESAKTVIYKFKLIFRTVSAVKSTVVKGTIDSGETKAGENDGLFWIPFPGENNMSEVGISNISVRQI